MRRLAAILLAALIAVTAAPAAACSTMPGYEVPSALDLAARADVIVLTRIVGERRSPSVRESVAQTRPVVLLKGAVLPTEIDLPGAYVADTPQTARAIERSAPRELRAPNAGALWGGCVRYAFLPDMQLVLFLKRDPSGRLIPIRSAFARDAEDVTGPDALWVKAVREYVAIGAAPQSAWGQRLTERAAQLRARGDPDSLVLAADLDIERANRARAAN